MNVGMHDRLASGGSIIEADVESIRLVLLLQERADFGDETPQIRLLFFGKIEEA